MKEVAPLCSPCDLRTVGINKVAWLDCSRPKMDPDWTRGDQAKLRANEFGRTGSVTVVEYGCLRNLGL